jgi:toxin YoeB
MGKYIIRIEDLAKKHLKQHFKAGNASTLKKIEKILIELSETPFTGIGNPEALKYELTGF